MDTGVGSLAVACVAGENVDGPGTTCGNEQKAREEKRMGRIAAFKC